MSIRLYTPPVFNLLVSSLVVISLFADKAHAEITQALPKIEVGVLAGYLSWPHYFGAQERYTLPAALPYLIYRGERLQLDRKGVRGLLLSGRRFALDLGFSFHPPVHAIDSAARTGMRDLAVGGGVGPRFIALIHRINEEWALLFRLPVRFVGDIEGRSHGWTAEPNVLLTSKTLRSGWSGYLSVATLYGSERFNDYYYGVSRKDARLFRPAYDPTDGIVTMSSTVGVKYQGRASLSGGFYLQGWSMNRGVVAQSPLVKRERDFAVGAWVAWTFWQSTAREVRREGVIGLADDAER